MNIGTLSVFCLLDLLVLVLAILDGADVKRRPIGKDESGGSQPLVSAKIDIKIDIKIGILARIADEESVHKAYISNLPGVQNGLEHCFVEEAVAHPLGDDDVDLLDPVGQSHFFHFPFDQFDRIFEMVGLNETSISEYRGRSVEYGKV